MKTTEQTRRELFEAWLGSDCLDFQWDEKRNCYKNFTCHMAWRAFNAALDAVAIELPAKWNHILDGRGNGMYAEDEARDKAIDDCRTAIESTGLGLKIR